MQTLLNELGYWQLERAQQKSQRIEVLSQNSNTFIEDLSELKKEDLEAFTRVKFEAFLADANTYLIENKIQDGELGYHVLNLVTDRNTGKNILVNRGWVTAKANRNALPDFKNASHDWLIKGRVYPINKNLLSENAEIEQFGRVLRLPVFDQSILKSLESKLNIDLEDFIIRLDPGEENSLKINWQWVNMKPEKHLAYAFQWFALAFTLLIVSIVASLRKST